MMWWIDQKANRLTDSTKPISHLSVIIEHHPIPTPKFTVRLNLSLRFDPSSRDGDLPFFLQSAQFLFPSCLTRSLRVLAFRSVVALSTIEKG
jgi:hypothetical protein